MNPINIQTQYNGQTENYANGIMDYNKTSRELFYKITDFEFKNKNLLDIASGDGFDFVEYTRRGATIHGIDASEEFVENARAQYPHVNLVVGIMEQLPFADNSMDIITSKYALQTSADVPQVLREITRVLRPGGMLAYIAVHPMRQFLEKKKAYGADYFLQEIVESTFFEGKVTAREPSHTLNEYLSATFLKNFNLLYYTEQPEFPGAERINGHNYPVFFMVKAQKKEER